MKNVLHRLALKECELRLSELDNEIAAGNKVDSNIELYCFYVERFTEIIENQLNDFRLYMLVNNYCVRQLNMRNRWSDRWERWEKLAHWANTKMIENL